MGCLSELTFKTSYHKGRDDVAASFYLPCMRRASLYDRAVGFFRSTVFVIAWPALREFVQRGGKIRILCSQVLAAEDINALDQGYSARADTELASRLLEEVRSLLRDEVLRQPARVLAALVARGTVEIKIAILHDSEQRGVSGRIFHDKLGLFRDDCDNVVIFKGSMNETWTGLAADGNLESVDVAASWMGSRDLERVRTEETYFSDLWMDRYPTVKVRPFPVVAKSEFERAADSNWEESLSRLLREEGHESDPNGTGARVLRPHQAAGLASWVTNGRRGILAFATGSGKTLTAVAAIRDAIKVYGNVVVVVVPDRVLFAQWYDELTQCMKDLNAQILRAGAGHNRWRESLKLWTSPGDHPRIVLATLPTAATEEFREKLAAGEHLMLVADEVHRLGSTRRRQLLSGALFGARLGLSATPERAGDADGTRILLSFFHGVLEPRYSLADAVRDGVLTRYFYRPHPIAMSDAEADEWRLLTREIRQLRARISPDDHVRSDRLERMLFERARIVKHASAKVPLAVKVISEEFRPGHRWIVYCDDLNQLNTVSTALQSQGLRNMPYHSRMEGNRAETLRWLDRRGGIIVAIKCLDEGVDIPSITHALILASSKNPREFIQRRGRVLRKAEGKSLAYVHDALVLAPRNGEIGHGEYADPITAGELARAIEFARHAENPAAASDLRQIAIEVGIDWRNLLDTGTEDADD